METFMGKIMLTFSEFCNHKQKPVLEGVADAVDSIMQGKPKNIDLRALRLAIMAEYEAINLYERMADTVRSPKIKKMLLDIANEEKVHIGEFEHLLETLDKDHEPYKNEGEDEAKDLVGGKSK